MLKWRQFSLDVAVRGSVIGPLVAPSDGSDSGRMGLASRRPGSFGKGSWLSLSLGGDFRSLWGLRLSRKP